MVIPTETVLLCRFVGGAFASGPLATVGGTLADFWGPVDLGAATSVFAGAGPVAGPILGCAPLFILVDTLLTEM